MRTEMGVVDQAKLDLLCQILCRQRSQKAQPLAGPPRSETSARGPRLLGTGLGGCTRYDWTGVSPRPATSGPGGSRAEPLLRGRLLGKGRLLEPKSPSGENAGLRVGIEKETEDLTLVSTRHSLRQFPLCPYSSNERGRRYVCRRDPCSSASRPFRHGKHLDDRELLFSWKEKTRDRSHLIHRRSPDRRG
jgi:hypothetical protein